MTPNRIPPQETPGAPKKAPRKVGQKSSRQNSEEPLSPLSPVVGSTAYDPEDPFSMMDLAYRFGYRFENQLGMIDMGHEIYWHVRSKFDEQDAAHARDTQKENFPPSQANSQLPDETAPAARPIAGFWGRW